jgi:subtilisin family serine protease
MQTQIKTISQGDIALMSNIARAKYDLDGTGVKIGIISDSFGRAVGKPGEVFTTVAQDIATGDLPKEGVTVIEDKDPNASDTATDEGRGMAQIVHDVAPGAELYFHTGDGGGAAGLANAIYKLAEAGVDIIVDDLGFLQAPFFQDSEAAQAVDDVTEAGVVYISAAGNAGDDAFVDTFRGSIKSADVFQNIALPDDFAVKEGLVHDWNPDPNVVAPFVEFQVRDDVEI